MGAITQMPYEEKPVFRILEMTATFSSGDKTAGDFCINTKGKRKVSRCFKWREKGRVFGGIDRKTRPFYTSNPPVRIKCLRACSNFMLSWKGLMGAPETVSR